MRSLFLCFFILVSTVVSGQMFVLHPVLGDTISREEKINYLLFPEIDDTVFNYAIVDSIESTVIVKVETNSGLLELSLTEQEVQTYRANISKLAAFYTNDEEESVTKSVLIKKDSTVSMKGAFIGEKQQEQINKQVKRDMRLQNDNERQEMYKQGLETSPGSIELFSGKRRKKK